MISHDELLAAQANLWKAQERFSCWPLCSVTIRWGDGPGFAFPMGDAPGNHLECVLPGELLRDILDRKVHWNNAEIGCLIRFDRRPNIYMPDVHTLMSFFHLPRET